jgi:glycosyltransferase 2 family protein
MRRVFRTPRFWLGIGLSLALMAVALRGVSRDDLVRELAGADYRWLVPAGFMVVLGQIGRALRWQILFGRSERPPFGKAFAILSVGYLISVLLPLRLGDGVRAWLVETRTRADGAAALATVMVERAVDLLTIVFLLGLWVPAPGVAFAHRFLGVGDWLDEPALRWIVAGSAAGLYVALATVGGLASPVVRLAETALTRLGVGAERTARLASGMGRFLAAFAALRDPRTALATLATSIVIWWVGAASYWLVFQAFRIDLDMAGAVFAMCVGAVFAAILPPSPGYVGSFHTAIREALLFYPGQNLTPVSPALAASYAIVLHGLTLLLLIVVGAAAVAYLGVSTTDLTAPDRPEE